MITKVKELPKEIHKVILEVENNNEYQITLNEDTIDIKNFYMTSQDNPLATFLHDEEELHIVINSEFLKVNSDYVNQVIVSQLKRIKYKHIVMSNIRFMNEKMINQLLDQPLLEVVEFKKMLITRAMITRLKFQKTLKVVIGEDIEEAAYKELLERGIDALTIKKVVFTSERFNAYNLTKSSATFVESIIIDEKYDEEELSDFKNFLDINHELTDVYLKCELDLYFIKDLIGVIHQTNHKALNLIIEDSETTGKSIDVLIQLDNVFDGNNRIIIDINKTYLDLQTYKYYLNAFLAVKAISLPINLTRLETIYKAYENIVLSNVPNQIRHILYYQYLKTLGINNISLLDNHLILIHVNDLNYKYNGLLVSDIKDVKLVTSEKFLSTTNYYHFVDLPLFSFLNCPTHQEMKNYLETTHFETIINLTNQFYEVFGNEYNFKYINSGIKNIELVKDTLEQIYVQNRTNEFDKKTFFTIFCNVRQKEGKDNGTIISEIKNLVTNEQTPS